MNDSVFAVWTESLRDLWQRIERHDFEASVDLSFTRRLARDKAWSLSFARGVILEYRRFCFLAIAGVDPVTPSEEVDEVWHQHLTYSRDYWNVWCRDVLARPLHHDPTLGGPAEQNRFRAQYASTLARYENFFGAPPEAYWPPVRASAALPDIRCGTERVVASPGGAVAADQRQAGDAMTNPLDWTAGPFLSLYVLLALIAGIFVVMGRRSLGPPALRTQDHDLGLLDLAWLAGGSLTPWWCLQRSNRFEAWPRDHGRGGDSIKRFGCRLSGSPSCRNAGSGAGDGTC